MPSTELKALCLSIHDVAPATWPECLRLLEAVRAVADIPITWLLVPNYHNNPGPWSRCHEVLEGLMRKRHEMALHGYTHLDGGPPPTGLRQRFLRTAFARGEGEFAAIDAEQARRLLWLGQDWFHQRRWPLQGFVAPAWLMSEGTWQALASCRFAYTTTWSHFYLPQARRALYSPSLVYAARNGAGRLLSPYVADGLALMLRNAPLVRLGLHPPDCRDADLMRRFQHTLAHLLASREAMSKADFALRFGARPGPTSRRPSLPSDARHTGSSADSSHTDTRHPWH